MKIIMKVPTKILLIEDNRIYHNLLKDALQTENVVVICVSVCSKANSAKSKAYTTMRDGPARKLAAVFVIAQHRPQLSH